ncbi:MAG: TIGR04255 family protein [Candidatus Omnitrophica bacterium]|nr:TIGR04255 family protein [Candidatus Omnitrophota bacterium]
MSKVYPNSPLVEVVFEIRYPADLSIKCNIDKYAHRIKNKFPLIVPHPELAAHLYAFSNNQNTEIVKVGLDRFSYHAKEYKNGFESFEKIALQHVSEFIEIYKIETTVRTGLRYINHIPIVKVNGCIPLERYLNFDYKLPGTGSMPNKYELLHTILVVKVGDGKLQIVIEYREKPDLINSEILVLDFDYFLTGQLKSSEVNCHIQESHTHTKKIFEDLITDEYRRVMESG